MPAPLSPSEKAWSDDALTALPPLVDWGRVLDGVFLKSIRDEWPVGQEAFQFASAADGTTVMGRAWRADGASASVLLAHGMGEHCLRYERFATALNEVGISVYAYDHRGHGRTSPDALGDFGAAGWSGLVSDLGQGLGVARGQNPDVPLFLFGHCMGSFAAQSYLPEGSQKIDGVILSGSADFSVLAQFLAAAPEAATLTAFNAAFEPARTPFDWLSRDTAEVDKYIDDPLCGFDPSEASAASMLEGGLALVDPDRWSSIRSDLPVYLFVGDKDPVNADLALFHSLVEKFQKAGVASLETKVYPQGRHEMLNETNRDEVTADIVSWLQRHS